MPASSSKSKKKKAPQPQLVAGQATLLAFFPSSPSKKTASASPNSKKGVAAAAEVSTVTTTKTTTKTKTKHPSGRQPKYRLQKTQVKKLVPRDNNTQDRNDPPAPADAVAAQDDVYMTGRVVGYSEEDDTYQIEFDDGTQEETWTDAEVAWGVLLHQQLGVKVAKWFSSLQEDGLETEELFVGKVVRVTHDDNDTEDALYLVLYEDNDSEEMNAQQLKKYITLYSKRKSLGYRDSPEEEPEEKTRQVSPSSASTMQVDDEEEEQENEKEKEPEKEDKNGSKRSRRGKRISYKEPNDDDDDDGSETEQVAPSTKRSRRQRQPGAAASSNKKAPSRSASKTKMAKRKKGLDDDEESDFEMAAHDDDDFLEVDSEEEEDDDDDDMDLDDSDLDDEKPQKKKAARATAKSTTKTAASTAKKSAATKPANKKDEFSIKMEKDRSSYKPHNNPQKWPANGPYVDPVGVDPTHGIVEGIVAAQVRKVAKLLELVSHDAQEKKKPAAMGELTFPLRLQTACSGTDAPSIALGLVKESLDKMKMTDKDEDEDNNHKCLFEYSHEMSCEIEPFKQGYLGRNFPQVLLFPDITKLTASDQVKDVYGRLQQIPQGKIFVAGTSCKDFSMLKTTYRQDIEDKGTSGETFLAAVEFLEKFQPQVSIFENVDGAPWDKMQEYIQGRIFLGDRNKTKAIKDASKKADADKELKFSVNEKGQYVAEVVPRQVGIRAGSIVEGFVRGGDDATKVKPLLSDEKKVTGMINLGQLATKHKINLQNDTLVMVKKARYCTHLCKLDTKDYGLPQTRNRKYLFIWRSDDPNDDLGEYFQEIMDHLKTPLLHSMDAFLLPDTHDRIRCFREALRSGPGLLVKRERAKEKDFWDWDLSGVKDVTCHKAFRENNGIEDRSRWLTQWDTRGRKNLAPGLWPELFDCWNMRRLDMIDCFAAAAIRDAISRDPLHHSFTWDLSQNVTRAPFRAATVGVSGCVTPGGELLLPHRNRTVMGYEKLLLQGIPYYRLRPGPETEVQLSDLAGNAMSVPVVSAVQLAAICAPQLRRQRKLDRKVKLETFHFDQTYDGADGAVLSQRGDLFNVERETDVMAFTKVFENVGKDLAEDAFRSSVLCSCESSGTTTKDPKMLECAGCGWGVCHECSGRYQTCSHSLREIDVHGKDGRPDPHAFERKLRCAVPSILRLGPDSEKSLKNGEGLSSYSFLLQQVERKIGHWRLVYGAWEDHGAGRQVAEIRVHIGRLVKLDAEVGVSGYIRCFGPALRHKKPHRGRLNDSARLFFKVSKTIPRWEIPDSSTKSTLRLVGSEPCDSQRVLVGLNDVAARSLEAHKVNKSFLPPIESRNPLTKYDKLWKTWPGIIVVSGDASDRVNGTYRKLNCQQTIVLSALWRRDDGEGQSPMYIYYRPDVTRSGLDVAVFSPTPSYADGLEICELDNWIPENALDQAKQKTKATFLEWKNGPENLCVEVPNPIMSMMTQAESFHQQVCAACEQGLSAPILCSMKGLSKGVMNSLLEYNDTADDNSNVSTIDLEGKSATRNAKRLSVIAAPALLKFAAEDKLPLKLSKWFKLPKSVKFGHCVINVPPRPAERWQEAPGRAGVMERVYDNRESQEYYQRLFNRPQGFEVSVDKSHGKLVIRMNPSVAAHRAAAYLGGENTSSLEVDYCLAEIASMGEPGTREFRIPNSDAYSETSLSGLSLPLYPRQAKALTRMIEIESGGVPFPEEERSEIVLPGVGWCLMARASKKSPLRGGVLGDAIGSGKTVVTIALILAGAEKARANRSVEKRRSSATLIVVPPGLVKQWDEERKKFTKNKLKCIIVDCTSTLMKLTVKDICEADMIIVPAGIIEEAIGGKKRPYTELLSKKAGAGYIPPAPTHYSQREAPTIEGTWVRNMASGPEIYVGNRGNQRTRDAQAYYSHCYSEAIAKLRQKTFGPSERGVPLEYFVFERIVTDECHETLVTGKSHETKAADFKEKARRGAREFLGVAETDITKRPLVAAAGVWGLTGTPLLETEARVTELANLMGGTYLTGACHHWRREETESGRDLFLNQQEGTRSREYRCAVQEACHSYVKEACQRNRGEKLLVQKVEDRKCVNMTPSEGDQFLKQASDTEQESFAISPDQLGEKVADVLSISASSEARQAALLEKISSIHREEPKAKILVFANSSYGGYDSALKTLRSLGQNRFSYVDDSDSVMKQNDIISEFRHKDATDKDRESARVLLLSFEQAAGHNLQEACHHVILYDPMYSGSDAVADASVEEQAVGRVWRQGQIDDVSVTRLIVKGPNGEDCVDDWIVDRNLDKKVLEAATSNFD